MEATGPVGRAVAILAAVVSSAHVIAQEPSGKVFYFDPKYDTYYCRDLEQVSAYFEKRGFRVMDTPSLVAWMGRRVETNTSANTVVLMATGVTPKALVEPWDKRCLLYRYCHDGGRFVSAAGNPLSRFQGRTDIGVLRQDGNYKTPQHVLINAFNVTPVYGLTGKGRELTDAGRRWGLSDGKWLRYIVSGVPPKNLTEVLVRSKDGAAVNVWLVTVNPRYPHSGLLGLAVFVDTTEWKLSEIYKLCVFDGRPVTTVPDVEWQQKDGPPAIDIDISMKPGTNERRAYLRGETIPLRVRVSGRGYKGQEVRVELRMGTDVLWEKRHVTVEATERVATRGLRCGEYELTVSVASAAKSERVWICPERPRNAFPMHVLKETRPNLYREEVAARWLRDHCLNTNVFDGHRYGNPEQRHHLARCLDIALRYNLRANARLSALPLYADPDRKDEWLILPDGETLKHGLKVAIGWRAILAHHARKVREGYREQAALLRGIGSPALQPFFYINDDGSMPGYYDFSDGTLADFEKQTGLSRRDLPRLKPEKLNQWSKGKFLAEHPEGLVPDDHPWLAYLRYHAGNYGSINRAAMEGIQAGWPGSFVGDIACMAGPLFIERGIYPPIYNQPLNTATFYMYKFRPQYYTFSAEAMRMNNRGKRSGFIISSSHTNWGRVFQRSTTYHTLAENPRSLSFYALDATPMPSLADRVTEQYDELRQIGQRVSRVAALLEKARVPRKRSALLVGFTQSCFCPYDRETQYAAFANLLRAGADVELVCEEEILDGEAKAYQTIVLNGVRWLREGVHAALVRYVRGGGAVLCDAGTKIDIPGAIRLGRTIAKSGGDVGRPKEIGFCRSLVGRHLPALRPVSSTDPDTVVRILNAGEQTLAWVLDVESEQELRGMSHAKSRDWRNGMYEYLTDRAGAEPSTKKPMSVHDGHCVYDLWRSTEVPLTDGRGVVEVQYLGATLLALYPERIAKLSAETSDVRIRRGARASFGFKLHGDTSLRFQGMVPVEITVHYPDGQEAWEYGANTVLVDGTLEVELSIARNDPLGRWRLAVRELCSGKSAEIVIEVVE